MNLKGLVDCHVHSNNSPDGNDSVDKLCQFAADNAMAVLTITDHCEVNAYYEDGYDKTIAASVKNIEEAKIKFDGRLKVLTGIELGQPLHDIKSAEKALSVANFDFIIGSLHNLDGKEDFYYMDYQREDVYLLLDQYYAELLQMAKWNQFDVLGHITYPLRYICGDHGIEVDMQRYDDIINEIFHVLVSNGKGIEINTSGLRQKIGKTLPDLKYVEQFKKMGGEIITLGSDSHKAEDIGSNIRDGAIIAKQAGFDNICIFENRKPIMLPIDNMIDISL